MDVGADLEKTKAKLSGKAVAAPIKLPDVADSSKQGPPHRSFTAEEKQAHFKKKKAEFDLEVERGVAAAVAALYPDKKKSFAAVVSTTPPDPPPAVCINCDKIGHPPWQCRS